MLKGINTVLSPELLKILCEMGHGDEIVIADANFPAVSLGKRLVRADGIGADILLDAILGVFPLDYYVGEQVVLMEVAKGDSVIPKIWVEYEKTISKYDPRANIIRIERQEFYNRAQRAYAVVATGERAQYGNILLKKGVIQE